MIVSGIVAIGGFVFANNPGNPTATCQGRVMRAGDTCVETTTTRQEVRTVEQQAEMQRAKRGRYGLGAGIAGSIVFVCAAGYLALLVGVKREKTREDARPQLGLRRKLAEENGWQFTAEDPAIERTFPAKARKDKAQGTFTEVVRGELDGVRFEAFDHSYQRYDKKGVTDERNTVVLFHHPGLLLDDVSVFADQVYPAQATPLVLTKQLQSAMRRLNVTNFTLFEGTVVVARALIRDHKTGKLHDLLRAVRALLDELPATTMDRTRT
ncbi:hypothetical protein [Paractinoplanes deccanensis]|uniref:hypothetical protein n=1 Tax=Paractinoplanes deccanensis TaxID=113561 RepID=UPI001940A59B|nr:hypothetical protein [Actinoplanes deccanensis]